MALPPAFKGSHEPAHSSTNNQDTDSSFGVAGWKTVVMVRACACPALRIKLVLVAGGVDGELSHIGLFYLNLAGYDEKSPESIDG